jgi:pyruvate/2-oxoglutarate dehydrogenase complex dihydrolipoamide dehydrogenase (E3) component
VGGKDRDTDHGDVSRVCWKGNLRAHEFVINADTDEILGAPLLRIDAREIMNAVCCRRASRRAALCDAIDTHPSRTEAFNAVLVTIVPPRRAAGRPP